MHFTLNTDGGARGNPGPAGAGALVCDKKGNAIARVSRFLGERTNNFAEYEAAILGLEALVEHVGIETCGSTNVEIKMDSELVVKQMRGEYKIKNPAMKEQAARLKKIMATFGSVSFTHVPREENGGADALANEAMDRGS